METKCFTILEIADITKAEIVNSNRLGDRVCSLLTDSRNLIEAENCMFIALKTAKNDAHKYIELLYQQGLRLFLVEYVPNDCKALNEACFLIVKDSLHSLQLIAASNREKFTIPVVGITGSNGKTIVKEWVVSLLSEDYKLVNSPKSYNSQIGVPLSVWEMKEEHNFAVFEAGISQVGEMQNLEKIIRPTIGIFTNIGSAHDEYFYNREEKIMEKLKLFANVDTLICCLDDFELRPKIYDIASDNSIKVVSWSSKVDSEATLVVLDKVYIDNGTKISAVYNEVERDIFIPFKDAASIENAIHSWVLMLVLDYSDKLIQERMAKLQAVEMRMEMHEGINHCFIINDTYNSDYTSFAMALDVLSNQNRYEKKKVIFSDILQSGCSEVELYADIVYLLEKKNIKSIICIGKALLRQCYLFEKFDVSFYNDTETFLLEVDANVFRDEAILLKGARSFGFEKINRFLQKKLHETKLKVNIGALVHNFNYFKSLLEPKTKIMVMAKAFSYGIGSYAIANILENNNLDYLAVAYIDEGIVLRKKGIKLPIMVMNAEEHGMDSVLRFDLEPEIYSFRMLKALHKSLNEFGSTDLNPVNIHIKLDTGMYRLGFCENEIEDLINMLKGDSRYIVKSVFTHLASADDAREDKFTLKQFNKYDEMSSRICSAFPENKILRHVLNTAGICRFPEYQFDMVRLGIGLYGLALDQKTQAKLQIVSSLKTVIAQIKEVKQGETVGYSRNFIAKSDMRIGVVCIGYADGLNRALGNSVGKLMVNGVKVPIIGNVCMDMCVIDLTGVEANEKDEVIVFGEDMPIKDIAEITNTIVYEVLTNVSPRVKRTYYQE